MKKKKFTWPALKSFMTGLHWSLANFVALLYGLLKKDFYTRIQLEQLIQNPESSLDSIFKFLNLEPAASDYNPNEYIPLTHQLSGNAIRNKKALKLDPTTQKRITLPQLEKFFLSVSSYLFRKILGY